MIITEEQIKKIKEVLYSDESFDKFVNPENPLYKDYKDRDYEFWHDQGNNNAVHSILKILNIT